MRSLPPGLVATLLVGTVASAAEPITPHDLDRRAVEVLKEVHNRGAELYNRDDALSCHRMYESALRTVKPFLAHHPAVQKTIDDGLVLIAKAEGVKAQAFKGHEVIEQVRTILKGEISKADGGAKPAPKEEPQPKVEPKPAAAAGVVTLDGQPLAKGSVTLVGLDMKAPRVFVLDVKDGKYTAKKPVPVGRYAVSISGVKVPVKYHQPGTSGITLTVTDKVNSFDLALRSK